VKYLFGLMLFCNVPAVGLTLYRFGAEPIVYFCLAGCVFFGMFLAVAIEAAIE
jgi:hypothetical protein